MNISSILITIVGIIIILGIYVISRVNQSKFSHNKPAEIPEIKDKDGKAFTSILDDIPASEKIPAKESKAIPSQDSSTKQQIVLFISGKDEKGLDGALIKDTLESNGLKLGEKDIYHYFVETDNQSNSLFRVANGVAPWTLRDEDLKNTNILGISMVMLLPNTLSNKKATELFMQMADKITENVDGILKNQQQELLTMSDRKKIIES